MSSLELPLGWRRAVSRSTGKTYYVHAALGLSQFEFPTKPSTATKVATAQRQSSASAASSTEVTAPEDSTLSGQVSCSAKASQSFIKTFGRGYAVTIVQKEVQDSAPSVASTPAFADVLRQQVKEKAVEAYDSQQKALKELVFQAMQNAEFEIDTAGRETVVRMPFSSSTQLPHLLAALDAAKSKPGILVESHNVDVTSLEEVFLKIATGADKEMEKIIISGLPPDLEMLNGEYAAQPMKMVNQRQTFWHAQGYFLFFQTDGDTLALATDSRALTNLNTVGCNADSIWLLRWVRTADRVVLQRQNTNGSFFPLVDPAGDIGYSIDFPARFRYLCGPFFFRHGLAADVCTYMDTSSLGYIMFAPPLRARRPDVTLALVQRCWWPVCDLGADSRYWYAFKRTDGYWILSQPNLMLANVTATPLAVTLDLVEHAGEEKLDTVNKEIKDLTDGATQPQAQGESSSGSLAVHPEATKAELSGSKAPADPGCDNTASRRASDEETAVTSKASSSSRKPAKRKAASQAKEPQAKKEAKKGGCIDVEDSLKYYQVHLSALGADALKIRFDSECDSKVLLEIFKNNTYAGPRDFKGQLEAFTIRSADVVLDLGANIGASVLWYLKKGVRHVYAVEPQNSTAVGGTFAQLQLNHGTKNNVTLINAAVSHGKSVDQAGCMRLPVTASDVLISSTRGFITLALEDKTKLYVHDAANDMDLLHVAYTDPWELVPHPCKCNLSAAGDEKGTTIQRVKDIVGQQGGLIEMEKSSHPACHQIL